MAITIIITINFNCNWPIVIGNQQLPAFLLVLLDGSFLCSTVYIVLTYWFFLFSTMVVVLRNQ